MLIYLQRAPLGEPASIPTRDRAQLRNGHDQPAHPLYALEMNLLW